jgi:hypothetical protein
VVDLNLPAAQARGDRPRWRRSAPGDGSHTSITT